MKVVKVTPEAWKDMGEMAHLLAFGKHLPIEKTRIDFALLVVDSNDKPMGYVTCKELDADTLYWQFGGAFPDTRDTVRTFPGYQAFVRFTKELGYKRIATYIENTNAVMLKMAAKVGYRIVGVRNFGGAVLLEHLLEFRED